MLISKASPPGFFIPARSSRHRTACLALYRALLQQAPRIPLPDDLATAWGPNTHPIKRVIRRAFRRNRNDTSPRLVYPALKAGYRILALLRAAQAPQSPDHASVLSFLRARQAERARTLAAQAAHPPHSRNPARPSTAPRPETVPLLVDVTPAPTPWEPAPPPRFETPHRPRPASALGGSGRRQVPRLDMAGDFPFLRLGKPQPRVLSRVLTQKIRGRVKRVYAALDLFDEGLVDAELEDEWEGLVADMLNPGRKPEPARRWQKNGGAGKRARGPATWDDSWNEDTFLQVVKQHGVDFMNEYLTRERMTLVARADAMRRLIAQEKELAEQEKAQRNALRRQRWEAKMQALHGDGWRDLFPKLKENPQAKQRERMSEPVQITDHF
ncbi:hypothetical protein F4779DRAFT_637012 [Xylariaceae sp. FL0662B]|nr:hypothetical protein F4779DRAFT_637012 [Xylariaceae sp. FL0662B]